VWHIAVVVLFQSASQVIGQSDIEAVGAQFTLQNIDVEKLHLSLRET
jgi:hypothetical protein